MRALIIAGIIVMKMFSPAYGDPAIKEPNVAGQFYPDDPRELSKDIDLFFAAADQKPLANVSVIIAPHAGYFFSGPVAAYSFRAVAERKFSTIVVIAPSHFFPFEGISVWDKGGFKTPLGTVPVDEEFTGALLKENGRFQVLPQVYEREHALEVELPFLQKTFKDFAIVPILMGQPDPDVCKALAQALDKLIGERKDVLIVVSTDMSHYHTDEVARSMDRGTLDAVEKIQLDSFWNGMATGKMEMCGFTGTMTALLFAHQRNLKAQVLKYANSSDASGDKSRVVGYGSVVFLKEAAKAGEAEAAEGGNEDLKVGSFSLVQKKELIRIAKETIQEFVRTGKVKDVKETDPRFLTMEGAFVTIRKHGDLRGCIGHIIGSQPLYLTVRDMAVAAASQDPRFDPLSPQELGDIDVEVSVLSIPRPASVDEIELGKHGVIVSQGYRQGLFLPQVATETGWDKTTFLSELCSQKAGLPADAWKDPRTKIEIFTAEVFSEKDVQ